MEVIDPQREGGPPFTAVDEVSLRSDASALRGMDRRTLPTRRDARKETSSYASTSPFELSNEGEKAGELSNLDTQGSCPPCLKGDVSKADRGIPGAAFTGNM